MHNYSTFFLDIKHFIKTHDVKHTKISQLQMGINSKQNGEPTRYQMG